MAIAMIKMPLRMAVCLVLLGLCGCHSPAPEPQRTAGIRLGELAPIDAPRQGMTLPPSVSLEVTTFAVPAAEYDRTIALVMAGLQSGRGILKNAEDFQANGFAAGTGGGPAMLKTVGILQKAGARAIRTDYLAVFDENGYDVTMASVAGNRSVAYTSAGTRSEVVLSPGRLVLRATVKRFAGRASVLKLLVEPVWQPYSGPTFVERTSGISRDFVFGAADVELNIQAGDFVLVAPAASTIEQSSLAAAFMGHGGGREMRVAIIACAGVKQ
jgi:hypothetical protein